LDHRRNMDTDNFRETHHHYSVIIETRTTREILVSATDSIHAQKIASNLIESIPDMGKTLSRGVFIHDDPSVVAIEDLDLHSSK